MVRHAVTPFLLLLAALTAPQRRIAPHCCCGH